MHAMTAGFGALFLLLAASATQSQTPPPSFESRTGQPLPRAGAYFDPTQSGVGLMLDVGLDGTVFAGLGVYDTSGAPRFHTLQGRIQRDGLTGDAATWIGVVRSPVWASRDGQCLGCEWRPPVTEVDLSLGEAELRFTAASAVELRLAGSTWRMQRMDIDRAPAELFAGDHLWVLDTAAPGSAAVRRTARIRVATTPAVAVAVNGPTECSAGPAPGAPMFALTCSGDCADFAAWQSGADRRVLAWPAAQAAAFHVAPVRPDDRGGYVAAADAVHTVHVGAFASRSSLPDPRCAAPGTRSTLRLYRDPVASATSLEPWPAPFWEFGNERFLATDGIYYDPSQPGTGILMARGIEGALFAGWFGYTADGRSTYRLFQAQARDAFSTSLNGPFPSVDLIGVTGAKSTPLVSSGGQVLGQPWRPNQVVVDAAAGDAALVSQEYSGHELDAWFGGRQQRLVRLPIDREGADFMLDRWLLVSDTRYAREGGEVLQSDPTRAEFRSVVVAERIALSTLQGDTLRDAAVDAAYVLRCIANCAGFDTLRNWLSEPGYGMPGTAEFVLTFRPRSRGPGNLAAPPASSYATATLRFAMPTASGLQLVSLTSRPEWSLGALNRDHLLGRGTGYVFRSSPLSIRFVQSGSLRLLRYPRDPD